jgi:hypothetical protein
MEFLMSKMIIVLCTWDSLTHLIIHLQIDFLFYVRWYLFSDGSMHNLHACIFFHHFVFWFDPRIIWPADALDRDCSKCTALVPA